MHWNRCTSFSPPNAYTLSRSPRRSTRSGSRALCLTQCFHRSEDRFSLHALDNFASSRPSTSASSKRSSSTVHILCLPISVSHLYLYRPSPEKQGFHSEKIPSKNSANWSSPTALHRAELPPLASESQSGERSITCHVRLLIAPAITTFRWPRSYPQAQVEPSGTNSSAHVASTSPKFSPV